MIQNRLKHTVFANSCHFKASACKYTEIRALDKASLNLVPAANLSLRRMLLKNLDSFNIKTKKLEANRIKKLKQKNKMKALRKK